MKRFLIKVNGKEYDVEVNEVKEEKSVPQDKTKPVSGQLPAKGPVPTADGGLKVTAPMPGTVLKIHTSQGAKIKKGEVLLILEAMKMENEIVSPSDGTIASLNILSGARVNAGDILLTIN